MRKAILGVVAIGALFLLGILAWWFMYTRQIHSELAQYEREVASKKKINVEFVVTPPANTPIDVAVSNWIDNGQAVPGRVTRTGDIRPLNKFHSDILNNERTILVYLPPGYEKSKDRYPVLYMNDGQNLFDEATSYQGIERKMEEGGQK